MSSEGLLFLARTTEASTPRLGLGGATGDFTLKISGLPGGSTRSSGSFRTQPHTRDLIYS